MDLTRLRIHYRVKSAAARLQSVWHANRRPFFLSVFQMIQFQTRGQMLSELLAPGCSILEIGVFRGEFASEIRARLAPRLQILCDPWDGPCVSGDADGNNVVGSDLRYVYDEMVRQTRGDPSWLLLRGRSPDALKELADASLDAVYIDGDHSYAGCAADLEEALRLVKPGGYIMGHDLEINPAKTEARYDFGVKRAVDEFCVKHGLSICAKGMDGCVSYAIRVPAREFLNFSGWGC
jgi:hypothetical protein